MYCQWFDYKIHGALLLKKWTVGSCSF